MAIPDTETPAPGAPAAALSAGVSQATAAAIAAPLPVVERKKGVTDAALNPPAAPTAPRLTVPAFIFAHFAHHVGSGGLQPLLPMIRDSFRLDYASAGMLMAAQGLALGFGQLPISALADRVSKRLMIAAGLIGVGLCSAAVAVSTSFWQLIPLLILTGIMMATYHAPAASFLAGAYSAARRGRALGTHVIGGSLAFVAAPLIAVGVARFTGEWRPAFLVLSLFPMVGGLAMIYLVVRHPEQKVATHQQDREQVNALRALRAIGPLVGVALAEQLLTSSMFAFIPLFIADRHGVPSDLAGLSIIFMTGIGIVVSPLAGALSDKLGRAPVLVFATATVGPLILALAYVPSGWLWVLAIVLLLYGLSMNARMPVLESLFADAIPAHRRSTVLGLYYFIGQESSALATPLVGRLIDVTDAMFTFTLLGIVGTVISFLLFAYRSSLLRPPARAALA